MKTVPYLNTGFIVSRIILLGDSMPCSAKNENSKPLSETTRLTGEPTAMDSESWNSVNESPWVRNQLRSNTCPRNRRHGRLRTPNLASSKSITLPSRGKHNERSRTWKFWETSTSIRSPVSKISKLRSFRETTRRPSRESLSVGITTRGSYRNG